MALSWVFDVAAGMREEFSYALKRSIVGAQALQFDPEFFPHTFSTGFT